MSPQPEPVKAKTTTKTRTAQPEPIKTADSKADSTTDLTKSAPPVPAAPRKLRAAGKSRPERALEHDDWGAAPPIPETPRVASPGPTIELMKASRLPKLEEVLNKD